MPQRYEPSASYKGFAQSHGFQPIRPADVTPLLRQNQETEQQNLQRALDQTRRVREINLDASDRQLQRELEADKYNRDMAMEARQRRFETLESNRQLEAVFSDKQMEDLMAFSKTITDSVLGVVEWNDNRIREEVLSEFYQQGLSEEQTLYFDTKEAAVDGATVMARTNAAILEANGAPTDLVQRARNANGARKKHMTEAVLRMAGDAYAGFRASAADKISVRIGDKDVTLANAANSSEWAAVNKKIRDEYLARFAGINAAMANKYLFPKIYETENKESTKFAVQLKENLLSERKLDFRRDLHSKIIGGADIKSIQNLLFLSSADFKGLGGARQEFFKVVKETLNSGLWKPEHVAHLRKVLFEDVAKFNDGSEDTFAKKFSYDMAVHGIDRALQKAEESPVRLAIEQRDAKADAFNLMFNTEMYKSDRRATDEHLAQLIADAKRDGIYDLVKDTIDNYVTVEEQDAKEANDLAKSLIAHKGYISEAESRLMPASVRAYWRQQNKIVSDPETIYDDNYIKERNRQVEALGWTLFSENGIKPQGTQWLDWQDFAKAEYDKFYLEAWQSQEYKTDQARHQSFADEFRKQAGNKNSRLVAPTPDVDRGKRFRTIAKQLIDTNHDLNIKLPGLQSSMDAMAQYTTTGKGEIPGELKDVARLVGKPVWDVYAAQAPLHGINPGPKPKVEQQLDGMHPVVQKLMRLHSSENRTRRAQAYASSRTHYQKTTPEARAALRLVRWFEGTEEHNGKPIDPYRTAYTYKRFESLADHPRVIYDNGKGLRSDASGAYQFLSTTWDGLAKKLGLKDFSESSQDQACLELFRQAKFPYNQELNEQNKNLLYLLASTFASIPKDGTGNSFYGNQKAKNIDEAMKYYYVALKEEREANSRFNEPGSQLQVTQ